MKKVQSLIAIIKLHINLDASVHALLLLEYLLAQAGGATHLYEMKDYLTCQYFFCPDCFMAKKNPKIQQWCQIMYRGIGDNSLVNVKHETLLSSLKNPWLEISPSLSILHSQQVANYY